MKRGFLLRFPYSIFQDNGCEALCVGFCKSSNIHKPTHLSWKLVQKPSSANERTSFDGKRYFNCSIENIKLAAFISPCQCCSVNDTRPLPKEVQMCRTAMKSQGWAREGSEIPTAQSIHSREAESRFSQLIHQKMHETYYQQVIKEKGGYWW